MLSIEPWTAAHDSEVVALARVLHEVMLRCDDLNTGWGTCRPWRHVDDAKRIIAELADLRVYLVPEP
jgi:hypothetical protein